MKKLIIEVRMNEGAKKEGNPNIPYRPDEIIDDATACAEAGAAVAHFHARTAEGGESNNPDDYRAVITGLRRRSDILIHTTLGQFHGVPADQRTAHIKSLADAGMAPDFAPLDMGSNNIDLWDPATATFGGGFVYQNTTADLRVMAEQLKSWNIKPQLAIWTVPNARLMGAFIDAGLLAEPVFPVLFLSGERFLAGHPATAAGLRAFVDLLPQRRIEWSVLCHDADLLPLIPEIVALGGHVSIGLGDYAYPGLRQPANADLVRRVVEISRTIGREVATPAEARQMLAA